MELRTQSHGSLSTRSGSGRRRTATRLLTVAQCLLLASATWAVGPSGRDQHDQRDYDARILHNAALKAAPSIDQELAVEALRAEVPGLAATFDEVLGVTRTLYNPTGYLTGPAFDKAAPADQALGFVKAHLPALGLSAADLAEIEVTDSVYSKVSGAHRIYLRQLYGGIPIFNAQLQININRAGRIISVNNAFVPNLGVALKSGGPRIGAAEAVAAAARHLNVELAVLPKAASSEGGVRQLTRIEVKSLSTRPITARLMWLPIRGGDVRLTWNFEVRTLDGQHWYDMNVDAESARVWTRFDLVDAHSYRVYPEPVESPLHTTPLPPADARVLVVNPEDATASPNDWFSGDGIMDGNNVHACADVDANNVCDSPQPTCSGGVCDFPIDLTAAPGASQGAAISNLFYWNNIIHDITYHYGFDEISGNFQEDNFGRGGAGSDSVNADAQDTSFPSPCNANFGTPADGANPRMQMFLCDNTVPDRDGDYDNGVIVHEYAHGISNRLVGGPANVLCLENTQQAGEGWSDLYALMYTAETGDAGTDVRGIGAYLFGTSLTTGIRDLPYSTDDAVNPWTYESINGAGVPHGVGSRWAQLAWRVHWALTDKWGFEEDLINFDINDPNEAGNKRAVFYVTEGLKNTACSPTFVDARDGIIQAAADNFGGDDVCDIWQAFADYGLGEDAVSGGSNSLNPTNGFAIPAACQCSPQPIADAGPDQTICLGDSTNVGTPAQPDNTYRWSPGGQTTAQITVSPSVDTTYTVTATTAACGSANDSATVFVDDGTTPAGLADDFEGDNSDWTTSGLWHAVTNSGCAAPENGFNSPVTAFYFGQDASCDYATGGTASGSLTSPIITGITATSTLSFDYFRVVESFAGDFDQTDVDIVTASGATNVFALNSGNASTAAWVNSGSISLAAFAGQQIQVRFTFNSGDNVANNFVGWFVDDVTVTGESQCSPTGCTSDAECDNDLFCDGTETCNLGTGLCEPGTAPDCGDGVSCTDDACNESTDACDNTPNDANCDNGLFCDGSETCDAVNDCQAGTPVACGDGVSCTVDACNEGTDSCDNLPTDSLCDDGAFCNGAEACDAVNDCQAGAPPVTDDGVGCTDDSCDEVNDVIVNTPNDANCDNGLFCDGSETCDAVNDCQAGSDPCVGQSCDEANDVCVACVVDADCSDGAFCNGAEVCNAGVCEAGVPPVVDDGVGCTVDSCDETNDVIVNAPNDGLCDDGAFCNGAETCDAVNDCQAGSDPCAPGETCNEATDICEVPGGNPTLWMSFRSNTAVPGVGTVADEDIVALDEVTGLWSLVFDGSDVGLGSLEISGLAVLGSGDLLLSFTQPGTVGGIAVDDSDIVQFTPTTLGANTAGSFSLFFDGSDVALTSNGEDVDSITFDGNGDLVISTTGGFSGTGASGADEDLFVFTGTFGTNTSGSFTLLFDGSDVGLGGNGAEDVDAAGLTAAGNLLFSTNGSFSVPGLTGADEDVVEFSGTFGNATSGTSTMRQDLSTRGIAAGEDIGSLELIE